MPSRSLRPVPRIMLYLVAGAMTGAGALLAAYAARPGLALEMDGRVPPVLTGFHDGERAGDETFAWSRRQATLRLPGLDRRGEWACTIRLRGGRQDEATLPEVLFSVDGIVTVRHRTANDFSNIRVPLPARTGSGAVITLTTDTFVPGRGDPRELGVFVDRWSCDPDAGFTPHPPGPAIRTAATAAAAFGGVLAVMGAPVAVAAAGILSVAGLQAVPLVRDLGPFSAFPLSIAGLATAVALLLCAMQVSFRFALGRPLSSAARVALFATAALLYLKLLALLHPSKFVVDAVFHAHRVEWVLEGTYFFTQLMPSGVRFPYAIGLYVVTAPWTLFTSDIVSLLRIVVTGAEAAGALLLYRLIVRCWGDRVVAATAAVLYALVPRTFEIVGNANMTNAFGQSAALAALVAATLWPLGRGRWGAWTGLTLLIAFALLCHISTFMLLGAILGVLVVLYWFVGRPSLRSEAWAIATTLLAAIALSTVLYYGHFGDAFRSAARVRAAPAASGVSTAASAAPSVPSKFIHATTFSIESIGWPIVLLAIPGVMAWRRRGWRDRLGLAIAALSITFGLFTLAVVVVPVGQSFNRYAVEFISRVTLATYPAIVIWAALGAACAWRAGGLARIAGAVAGTAALLVAARAWLNWIP